MKRWILVALMLSISTVVALAQSNTGRLVGTVSSPDGVVAGATVTITDNQTGKERKVVTSGEGSFSVAQLEIGAYTVTVTAAGFKTFTANNLKIDVGKEFPLNVTLEVGRIEEQTTVTAGADVVNATNAELNNTVSAQQIQALPLNGRDPLNLVLLQAGTASNSAQPTTINGQRSSFTNITRDGINIQDNYIRENAVDFAEHRSSVDDTAEFTITTQNADANKGYGASQIQIVTPRGENAFHGAAFLYNRNSEFSANDFFSNASGAGKPFLNRNEFGGKLAGPVVKNKLFFFGYYEGFRLRTSSGQLRTILLPQARQGIFTYRDNAGATRTINLLSPTLGTGITSIDPTVQSRILNNIPTVGNTTEEGDQRNTTGYRFNQKGNTDRNSYTSRIDYELNSRQTINGVFSYKKETNLRPDADGGEGYNATPVIFQPLSTKFLALAHRLTPSARFTNEVRGGFNISAPTFNRSVANPGFFIVPTLVNSPEVSFQEQGRFSHNYNIQDNAEFTRGNHSIRFGGQGQFFRIRAFADGGIIPTYALGVNQNTPALGASQFPGGISAAQLGAANGLLALLGGIVGAAGQNFNVTSRTSGYVSGATQENHFAYENIAFYAQDQWRVKPQLTLNFGLRYELYTALREQNGLALMPVIVGNDVVGSLLNPDGTYDFIQNNRYYNTDKDNFSPVVGFAYSPQFKNKFLGGLFPGGGRTVIRGGFRISYVNDELIRAADNAATGNNGLQFPASALGPDGTTSINGRLSNLPTIPRPTFQVPRSYEDNFLLDPTSAAFAINPRLQTPRVLEYNFSLQRELGFQTAFEIRYVGGQSNNLIRGTDFNQVNIRDNGFVDDFNRARSNLLLTGNPACTRTQNPGCQTLTVFPRLELNGLLGFGIPVIDNTILAGTPADLAILYFTNFFGGSEMFVRNPNVLVADLLDNGARFRYNSLQVEVRRRFSQGLSAQANYTFQKTLTNAVGTIQTRFEPFLDVRQPQLEYSRSDYDQTHILNFNGIYELPIGKGKRFLDRNGWVDRLLGGFTVTSIFRVASGAPISIVDPRGTLNRVGRSGRQTAVTSLTKDQIKDLIGIFKTPDGVFFINPNVINQATGRAAEGFGTTPFSGQVFFNNAPGQTSSLERAFINGPWYFNWDAGIIKNIRFGERVKLQFRAEAFNFLNRTNFAIDGPFAAANQQNGGGGIFNINSTNFGRVTNTFLPRIIQFAGRIEF